MGITNRTQDPGWVTAYLWENKTRQFVVSTGQDKNVPKILVKAVDLSQHTVHQVLIIRGIGKSITIRYDPNSPKLDTLKDAQISVCHGEWSYLYGEFNAIVDELPIKLAQTIREARIDTSPDLSLSCKH